MEGRFIELWSSDESSRSFEQIDATTVLIRLNNGATNSASNIVYFDAVLFEVASSLLPYFDGTYADTYTGYTLESQAWNGTADASTSTAVWGLTSSYVGTPMDSDYALS